MAIFETIFPTLSRAPTTQLMTFVSNSARSTNPLSGSVQTLSRPGTRMLLRLSYKDLSDDDGTADRQKLIALLAQLQANADARLRFIDTAWQLQGTGSTAGSPPLQVDGASQTGSTLLLKNGPISDSDFLKAGDRIGWVETASESPIDHRTMKIVTADAATDGAGAVTVSISPEHHYSPSDSLRVITTSGAIPQHWLLMDKQVQFGVQHPLISSFVFNLLEDIRVP